jgi:allophanate hydrolase
VLAEARRIDDASPGPLAGVLIAVKDNIDVAGLPTTAGCPAFAYTPERDAPAVARLRAAGALVLGKTNLDQFATGLVGTRSPYGAVHDARRPEYVAGGSSSGSAIAVALGIVDVALATDTAGSGRVPAAFQGLVGLKPTRGLVPLAGVVPACRTLDCVSVLAPDLPSARRVLWTMAGPRADADDAAAALERAWPSDAPLAAPPAPHLAVPQPAQLAELSADARRTFADFAQAAALRLGAELREVDITPLLEAAQLLYGGAFAAERHAAVGAFVAAHPDEVDPTVGAIIAAAGKPSASRLVSDGEALDELRVRAAAVMSGVDALLLPTVARQPTIAEVAADPVAVNSELGRYTNFANLLDMCAVALPAGSADGGCFGATLLAPAFGDLALADLAGRLRGEPLMDRIGPSGIELLVIGAHRAGQPLHHQLTDRGARLRGVVRTAPGYRMHALPTDPPKPGLVRVGDGGVRVEGELWELPAAQLGPFLAALPAPMALGRVALDDGREVVGFHCEPIALHDAPDISIHGSWLRYLDSLA